jgi:hypothetical protein
MRTLLKKKYLRYSRKDDCHQNNRFYDSTRRTA